MHSFHLLVRGRSLHISPLSLLALAGLLLLFLYLFLFRVGIYLPLAVFWGSLTIILSAIVTQAFGPVAMKLDELKLLSIVVVVTVGLLKTILVPIAVPFFGSDPYIEYAATQEIEAVGWTSLSAWGEHLSEWPHSTNYPMLSVISLALTRSAGVPLMFWARWGMSVLSLLSLGLVYAISRDVYQSRRVALLGTLGFGMTYMYLMFHSLYLREALAFPFFLAVVFAHGRAHQQSNRSSELFYRLSVIVLSIGIVLTHHLTALLLLAFLGLLLIVQHLSKSRLLSRYYQNERARTVQPTVWLLLLVSLLTYWLYLRHSPIEIIHTVLEEATAGGHIASFSLPSTLRYHFLLYGQMSSTLVLGLLAIYGFLFSTDRDGQRTTFLAWGGLTGVLTIVFALARIVGTSALASRFELFGYVFLIPAAAHGAISLGRRNRKLSYSLAVLFVLYALINVYRIPQYLYSQHQPDHLRGEVRASPLPEEFNLLTRLQKDMTVATDSALRRWVRPLSGAGAYDWFQNAPKNLSKPIDFDLLVVGERQSNLLEANFYTRSLEEVGLSRVYSTGNASVYVPSSMLGSSFSASHLLRTPPPHTFSTVLIQDWLLFTAQIGLLVLAGISVSRLARPQLQVGDFSMALILLLELVFVVYLISNSSGLINPDISVTAVLVTPIVFIALPLTRYVRDSRNRALALPYGWIVSLLIIFFAYAAVSDSLWQQSEAHPYTEFYIERIRSEEMGTVVELAIVNREGGPARYQIDGHSEVIHLSPLEMWQGAIRLGSAFESDYRIRLTKSTPTHHTDSLYLQLSGMGYVD